MEESDILSSLKVANAAALMESIYRKVGEFIEQCTLIRSAIEVVVADTADQPLADIAVELLRSRGGVLMAKTLYDGTTRFDGLCDEPYTLKLTGVGRGLWYVAEDESLDYERARSHGDARWTAAVDTTRNSRVHTVRQGECLIKLADQFGLLPETLAEHPENALLKEGGRTLGILAPGDEVFMPSLHLGTANVTVGRRYRIILNVMQATLSIRFLDNEEKPRAAMPYLISVKTLDGKVIADRLGETTAEGVLAENVPPSAYTAEICLGVGSTMEIYDIDIGHVDPIETLTGVQERLSSLGYNCDDERGYLGLSTHEALSAFQQDHDLTVSGEIDDQTRDKLLNLFLT